MKTLKPKRILLLFSGTQNDANVIVNLANRYKGTPIDLLHVRGHNRHSSRSFPTDVMYEITSLAPNVINCYSVNASVIEKFLQKKAISGLRCGTCQFCQISLHLILAYFIELYGYDPIIHCGPLFDERLCKVPAEMILKEPVISHWEYPLADYRLISQKVDQYCVRDSGQSWNNKLTMDEERIRALCQEIIDGRYLARLSMRETKIYYDPFSW